MRTPGPTVIGTDQPGVFSLDLRTVINNTETVPDSSRFLRQKNIRLGRFLFRLQNNRTLQFVITTEEMQVIVIQADPFAGIRTVTDTDGSVFFLVFDNRYGNRNFFFSRFKIGRYFNRAEITAVLYPGLPVQQGVFPECAPLFYGIQAHDDILAVTFEPDDFDRPEPDGIATVAHDFQGHFICLGIDNRFGICQFRPRITYSCNLSQQGNLCCFPIGHPENRTDRQFPSFFQLFNAGFERFGLFGDRSLECDIDSRDLDRFARIDVYNDPSRIVVRLFHSGMDDRRIVSFRFNQLTYFIRSLAVKPSQLCRIHLFIALPAQQLQIIRQYFFYRLGGIDDDVISNRFGTNRR